MTSRYSIILSFILATLLATGSVEFFYNSLGKVLTASKTDHNGVGKSSVHKVKKAPQEQDKGTGKVTDYTIITKRNLFGEAPNTTTTLPTKPQAILTTTSLDLILLGTIGGETVDRRAIIRNKKSGQEAIYATGDAIEQALIKQISRSRIILTVNGTDEVLFMAEMKSSTSTGTTKKHPIANAYTPPNRVIDEETIEAEEDTETTEKLPPAAIPRRRLTLKSLQQQVVEP